MKPWTVRTSAAQVLVDAARCGELTQAQARRLYSLGSEAVTLALLAASRRIAELQSPANAHEPHPCTPSGMLPIHQKPNTHKRRKKPGARQGHAGARRATPTRIDRRQSHRLRRCPHCEGRLQRCRRPRTRIIEDIPEDIQPLVTEHTIHRDYCPKCKRHVEPAAIIVSCLRSRLL